MNVQRSRATARSGVRMATMMPDWSRLARLVPLKCEAAAAISSRARGPAQCRAGRQCCPPRPRPGVAGEPMFAPTPDQRTRLAFACRVRKVTLPADPQIDVRKPRTTLYPEEMPVMRFYPTAEGLYDPRFEHDACGVSFVADLRGRRSHRIVELGLSALCNLDHRGALGADEGTGDGAGILIQIPDRFFRSVADFDLPAGGVLRHRHRVLAARPARGPPGDGPGRKDRQERRARGARLARGPDRTIGPRQGQQHTMPNFAQLFIAGGDLSAAWPSIAASIRCASASNTRSISRPVPTRATKRWAACPPRTTASTSHRCRHARSSTKACSRPCSCGRSSPISTDTRIESAIALVHSRFSTNTFPHLAAWRTPIDSSPTTARSTRCRPTATG